MVEGYPPMRNIHIPSEEYPTANASISLVMAQRAAGIPWTKNEPISIQTLLIASKTLVACTVAATLWTRKILHVWSLPSRHKGAIMEPTVAKSLSLASVTPVNFPRKPFRLVPTMIGMSCRWDRILSRFFSNSRLPVMSFAKPIPGSAICSHLGIPASSAALTRSFKLCVTSSTTLVYSVIDSMVSGVPRMCIKTIGTPISATVSNILSS
mmetsp:Transcript_13748/g.31261  ORF Transcript_13748/g.31261 Transcript_13748/m.31261 type:complete len:210 (-) Transcript_13748:805-1434(-)